PASQVARDAHPPREQREFVGLPRSRRGSVPADPVKIESEDRHKEMMERFDDHCEAAYRRGVHQSMFRAAQWLRLSGQKKAAEFMDRVANEANRLRAETTRRTRDVMLLEVLEKRAGAPRSHG